MKVIVAFFLLVLGVFQMPAAATDEAPAKLAIISESPDAASAVDVLTAVLNKNNRLQLLERTEIEKAYHEQEMSATSRNDLKLGRLLGADGLLLLNIVKTPQATNLTARLTAIKPGVVLTEGSFPWPLKDVSRWSESVAVGLDRFVSKLVLLPQDAIPVSLVNVRSAIESDEEKQTEQQLKLLTIQRLSAEPQLFVLERERMQLLGGEKELDSDESAFWSGTYLLEGVLDQGGYSKDTVTINARLTPPKGGGPLVFEVNGSRTNLAEVVNSMAAKVNELLKVNSTVPKSWNPAEEAAKYFDEANWALRWGVFTEAQAAADSAWALGKQDQDCAIARIKAYETPLHVRGYQNGNFTNPGNTNAVIETAVEAAAPNNPWGLILHTQVYGDTKSVDYAYALQFPDPASIDVATHALEIYYEFSRNSPEGLIKVASEQTHWKNSEWYNLGIEDLVAASTVLQQFNFVPEAQKTAGEKLAELRRSARMVADWIARSPSVYDSYFVGDRLATHDELANTMDENSTIFRCQVLWGCYWQERPEDAMALYHELMSSPVFCYIHSDFWLRELQKPRLAAWNQTDAQRIPRLWDDYLNELNSSTNVFWQLEARALALADADNDSDVALSFTNLFRAIFNNRDALVNDNVDAPYLGWHLENLVSAKTGNGISTDLRESLNQLFYSQYNQKLDAMENEYQNKTVAAAQFSAKFQEQKQYLKNNQSFNLFGFMDMFQSRDYSKRQATEILPLIVAYKSNLVAQSESASGMQKGQLMGAIGQVGFLEGDVNRLLGTPTPPPPPKVEAANPAATVTAPATISTDTNAPEVVTNVMTVDNFMEIPLDNLIRISGLDKIDRSQITVTAHQWLEGKLMINFEYELVNNWSGAADGSAIAMLDPATRQWNIVTCSKEEIASQSRFYHRSTLLHGGLFDSSRSVY